MFYKRAIYGYVMCDVSCRAVKLFLQRACFCVFVFCSLLLCVGCHNNAPSVYQSVRTKILAKNAETLKNNIKVELVRLKEEEQALEQEIKKYRFTVSNIETNFEATK